MDTVLKIISFGIGVAIAWFILGLLRRSSQNQEAKLQQEQAELKARQEILDLALQASKNKLELVKPADLKPDQVEDFWNKK